MHGVHDLWIGTYPASVLELSHINPLSLRKQLRFKAFNILYRDEHNLYSCI